MDRSILYGDGLFETVRLVDEKAWFLERHIARFVKSADALGYPQTQRQQGVDALQSLVGREDGLWRVTVTRAPGEGIIGGGEGGVFLHRRPIPQGDDPPRLCLQQNSYFPADALAEHKTTSWLRSLEALRRARERGFDEALRISPCKRVGEAAAANLFVLFQGQWLTPEVEGILPGVYRSVVLERARQAGLPVFEAKVTLEQLLASTSIVLTSSRRVVAPAASLEGRPLEAEPAEDLKALLKEE